MDLSGYFGQVWTTSEGWKANCPACNDTEKKFSWNVEKGVGCCFHSDCRWFYKNGGVTSNRLEAWFNAKGIGHVVPEIIQEADDADVSLPKEFRLVAELKPNDRENIYAYLSSRSLPKRIVDKAKIGYCPNGKMWGYIILPIFDQSGEVVYWQGRRFKDREPKFYNPKSSKKSELVYCVSPGSRPHKVIIVESAINALTLESMEKGRTMIVGILGKSLSLAQMDRILVCERYLQELVVALDGDARRDTVDIADKFVGVVPLVKIANIPDGEDINSLGREKAWRLVNNAEIYNRKNRIEFMTRVT